MILDCLNFEILNKLRCLPYHIYAAASYLSFIFNPRNIEFAIKICFNLLRTNSSTKNFFVNTNKKIK